jgi:LmbE family N-acetylglucosaminyl deacetylase
MTTEVLSPHFDDAVLSCWNLVDQSEQVSVVTVFGGIPAAGTSTVWDRRCGQPDSEAMMRDRIHENEVALSDTNAQVVNLPHLDGQYISEERDVERITQSILEVADQDSIIYAPIAIAGMRKHPDHLVVQQAAQQMLEEGRDVAFYADLPYAIPLLVGERNWPARKSTTRLGRSIGVKLEAEIVELSPEQQADKEEALKDYASQFNPLRAIRRGLLSKKYFYRYEMLFRPA